jgi:hypothetical protein
MQRSSTVDDGPAAAECSPVLAGVQGIPNSY